MCDRFYFQVIFGGRCYVANRGIPQGSSVSVRLCNLYLGAMERERYANLINNKDTLLFRYVDDYVLLTTEFSVANHVSSIIKYVLFLSMLCSIYFTTLESNYYTVILFYAMALWLFFYITVLFKLLPHVVF